MTIKHVRNTAIAPLALAVLLVTSDVGAQSQPSSAAAQSAGQVKIGHIDHGPAMQRLLDSARKLREAIQQLARQQPGEPRSKAMDAAQEALLSTQLAMLKLPPDQRVEDVMIREPTDWPKAMARLDSAASALQDAVIAISKQAPGSGRDQSVAAVNKALTETQQAMLAIPRSNSNN